MIALSLLLLALQTAEPAPSSRAAAMAEAAGQAADAVSETDLDAVCRQAGIAQQRLRDIADRETAARVILMRYIDRTEGAYETLGEAEALLQDQDDLALAHMVLEWSRNRSCGKSVAP